jgi:hypothetical protein
MSTVDSVVRAALLHLRVIPARQPIKAQDMADGIDALNRMMTRWEADGVALGWHEVSSPGDDLPVPPEAEEAVGYNLALRLRAAWGADLDPDVIEFAREGLAAILRDIASRDAARLSYDLPAAQAYGPHGDFYGGGY